MSTPIAIAYPDAGAAGGATWGGLIGLILLGPFLGMARAALGEAAAVS